MSTPPSWFDLVARIRAAAPGVPLRIWRQEDYRANARAIMEALCGRPLGPLPEISDPTWTRSPSASAIARAEALPRDLPRAERLARVGEIFAAAEPGADRFRPFSPVERQRLRRPLRGRPRAHRAGLSRRADALRAEGARRLSRGGLKSQRLKAGTRADTVPFRTFPEALTREGQSVAISMT